MEEGHVAFTASNIFLQPLGSLQTGVSVMASGVSAYRQCRMKGCVMQSALLACSPIGVHRIQHNDESRAVIVDHMLIRFSPTEYRLLKPLLNSSPAPITDSELVREAFACDMSNGMRANLDKHFDKIRSKLRPSGLDVYRVTRYGYVLLAIPDEAYLHLQGS